MLLGARNDVQGCEGLVEKGVLWPLLEAATEEDAPACIQDTQGAAFIPASTETEPRQLLRRVCACLRIAKLCMEALMLQWRTCAQLCQRLCGGVRLD